LQRLAIEFRYLLESMDCISWAASVGQVARRLVETEENKASQKHHEGLGNNNVK
ncbi:hypothetical protein FRB95_006585, partial [Tulasnella sp. JGI-2019a]